MRLLIVSATNQRRGAETESFELGKHLRASGVDVDHIALSDVGASQPRLEIEPIGHDWRLLSTLHRLRQRAIQADLALAFGSTALPACAIGLFGSGVPFVYRSIGDPRHWVRSRLHSLRTGLLIRRSGHVIALWQGAADAIAESYGYPIDQISVIPNARSATEFPLVTNEDRRAAREKLALRSDDRVVAVVGSLTPEKCVDLAIESVALDNSLKLLIAGDGELRSQLEDLASRKSPGRVTFLGNTENVRQVYSAADLVLITSRTEGMPGVVIEAGFSGIPVVSTDVGAVSEMIQVGENGGIATTCAESVIDLIVKMMANHEQPSEIREAALLRYDWGTVTPKWLEVLSSATN